MTPQDAEAWVRVILDTISFFFGLYLLHHEFWELVTPDKYAVALGASACAFPPVRRSIGRMRR